jgi:hypothetical protein
MKLNIKKNGNKTTVSVELPHKIKNSNFERFTSSEILAEAKKVLKDESLIIRSGPDAVDNRHGANSAEWILETPSTSRSQIKKEIKAPSPRRSRRKQEKSS